MLKRYSLHTGVVAVFFALSLAFTFTVYLPSLSAGFYFDDLPNIIEADALHMTTASWSSFRKVLLESTLQTRPIANLSFALNYLIGGLEPRGYHIVNVGIHLAAGIALAWVCILLLRERNDVDAARAAKISVVTASLFLLHPLNTQAVTYVVQRMTSLATLFSLLALGTYLHARHYRRFWMFVVSLFLWLLSLGSKEIALATPAVLLLYEYCFHRHGWVNRFRLSMHKKFVLLTGITVFLSFLVLAGVTLNSHARWKTSFPDRNFTGAERMLTESRIQLYYLSLVAWPAPSRLSLEHDYLVSRSLFNPPTTIFAVVFWTLATGIGFYLAKHRPRYGFPLLMYLTLHLLESGPFNLELIFEHRMYFPMTALIIIAANAIYDVRRPYDVPVFVLTGLLVLPLAYATHTRNNVWKDPLAFHLDAAKNAPKKARVYNNLGNVLLLSGLTEAAITEYEKTLQLELNPTSYEAHSRAAFNLALCYEQLNQTDIAIYYYRYFLNVVPTGDPMHAQRARQALQRLEQALRSSHRNTDNR